MPDIKSALAKALDEWSREEETQFKQPEEKQMDPRSNMPQTFKITNNIARRTFEYVRDNPGLKAKEVGRHFGSLGLKPHSAVAMMSASIKCGVMRRDEDSRYYTTIPEYRPLKKPKPQSTPSASIKAPKPITSKGIKALLPEPTRTVEPELTNDYILSKLDVRQALSLYRELINIFTGKL